MKLKSAYEVLTAKEIDEMLDVVEKAHAGDTIICGIDYDGVIHFEAHPNEEAYSKGFAKVRMGLWVWHSVVATLGDKESTREFMLRLGDFYHLIRVQYASPDKWMKIKPVGVPHLTRRGGQYGGRDELPNVQQQSRCPSEHRSAVLLVRS